MGLPDEQEINRNPAMKNETLLKSLKKQQQFSAKRVLPLVIQHILVFK